MDISPTFCAMPWTHISTTTAGELRPCCISEAPPSGHRIEDDNGIARFWHGETMRRMRRDMLAGRWPAACRRCETVEASGAESLRGVTNHAFGRAAAEAAAHTDVEGNAPLLLKFIDLHTGNLCNLRCQMCSPRHSHLLAAEWAKLHPTAKPFPTDPITLDPERAIENLTPFMEGIDTLYFSGGEPLLSSAHNRLIDALCETGHAGHINLRYSTNGTAVTDEIIERWSGFRDVSLNVSIDGVGALNHYIRYPAQWSVIERSLSRLAQATHRMPLSVSVSYTFQALNATRLPEMIAWLEDKQGIAPLPFVNVLTSPAHMDSRVLPRALREKAADDITTLVARLEHTLAGRDASRMQRLRGAARFLLSADHESRFRDFVEITGRTDALRRVRLPDILPELAPYLPVSDRIEEP